MDIAGNRLACTRLTRPDTRPPVADGWAGVEMRIFPLFISSMTDRRTNQPNNQPTNQPTNRRTDKASYRVACPQLKTGKKTNGWFFPSHSNFQIQFAGLPISQWFVKGSIKLIYYLSLYVTIIQG